MGKTEKISTTVGLVVLIIIIINILAHLYTFRLDFTENREYTLSRATKNILKNLDRPVTVTAYFSKNLPPHVINISTALKDLLVEYNNRSKGLVVYRFVNPNEKEELEQEAIKNGIQPVMINVREKDQVKQQKAYMGAVVSMGDSKEIIPFFQPGAAMEYALSAAIKKLSVTEKPSVAIIQGHGEPSINEITQAYSELSVLYNVEPYTINDTTDIPAKYKTVAIIRPKDTIPSKDLAKLDRFLEKGGNILLAFDRVEGDFSVPMGRPVSYGLEEWLQNKGITVSESFIIDTKCGYVTLQQQQGNFIMSTQIQFPYLPIIAKFADNPVTKGLESVSMQFASPINFTGDSLKKFTPIAFSSERSGTIKAPLYFDVQRQWTQADFPVSNLVVAGILEGKLVGNANSKMIIISDGEFAVNVQRGFQLPEDNVSLLVNAIDWLSDETGLIDLRTKEVTSRPLKEIPDGRRAFLKWFNFLSPVIIILVYGLVRWQMNRNKRIKRMEVNYE